jgi:hypothetical protein
MKEGRCQKEKVFVAPRNTSASYKNIEKPAASRAGFSMGVAPEGTPASIKKYSRDYTLYFFVEITTGY